jgi:hypothetical protein
MLLYASAERGEREGTIITFTRNVRNKKGTSITLLSIKNSFKYFFTSFTSVESGEPRFINTIPLFAITEILFANVTEQKALEKVANYSDSFMTMMEILRF